MNYGHFFCRWDRMSRDSFSYGDWRQYVCQRTDGQTQCARFSQFPIIGLVIGLVAAVSIAMATPQAYFELGADHTNWVLAGLLFIVVSMPAWPFLLGWFVGYYLMKAVGPMNDGAWRVLPGEETR